MAYELKILPTAASTNSALPSDAPHATAVMALEQTAGRGQRGNRWEAEPGQNVTLSLLLRPRGLPAREQFVISQAVALGVADVLRRLMPGQEGIAIKWPNDIYVGHKKIAGILIENVLTGADITRCVVGLGLNVNQTVFRSDAPNPVSVAGLTGRSHDVEQVARQLVEAMLARYDDAMADPAATQGRYFAALYRADGNLYPYRDERTLKRFQARIEAVEPDGHLRLRLPGGELRRYAFKEVAYV